MAIERARTHALPRPWGVVDLMPWSKTNTEGTSIGEIWYERPGKPGSSPSLLLKLLLTSQPLSIQVHPDDAYAQSIGLPNGKTEAWYVLSAASGAKVALGLKRRLTPQQLREAIADGSISDLVVWQTVSANDVVSVPAGTIHAIGAGLVIAEIQQRSDATFRLFDYGRQRELHIESAIAVADAGPAPVQAPPSRLSNQRTLLVANPHFVFERIDLAPGTTWCLDAERETWLLVLSGGAIAGTFDVARGDAIFAQADRVHIRAGKIRMVGLVAYAGAGPARNLLQRLDATDAGRPKQVPVLPSHSRKGSLCG
jgi:mannose-6-phosphate isomerase